MDSENDFELARMLFIRVAMLNNYYETKRNALNELVPGLALFGPCIVKAISGTFGRFYSDKHVDQKFQCDIKDPMISITLHKDTGELFYADLPSTFPKEYLQIEV